MPCAGPTDEEIRGWEAEKNAKTYGKRWSDDELTMNVACAYSNYVRHGVALPSWARKWSEEHERLDAERRQQEKNQLEQKEAEEYQLYLRLKKRFG